MSSSPRILWSAGEPSGDRHAAHVVEELRRLRPDVVSLGLGGPAMAAAGVDLVGSMEDVAVVGLTEVIERLPRILRVWRRLRNVLARDKPALFVPVDFPGLNLRLAATARRHRVPVVYFISPQVWAWGARRIGVIRERVQRMLVVLPFEEPLYRRAGVPVTHVGHPLVEQTLEVTDRETARRAQGLEDGRRLLVLMPGSRPAEIRRHLSPMLDAAVRLRARRSDLDVAVRLAPGLDPRPIESAARTHGLETRVLTGGDSEVVRAADVAIVASGTATLETALLGTPMVIGYRVSPLTYAIARRLVRLDSIGLVNVVAGRRVVPELIQDDLTGEALDEAIAPLLEDGETRARQLAALREVADKLGTPGAAARTARAIVAELETVEPGVQVS